MIFTSIQKHKIAFKCWIQINFYFIQLLFLVNGNFLSLSLTRYISFKSYANLECQGTFFPNKIWFDVKCEKSSCTVVISVFFIDFLSSFDFVVSPSKCNIERGRALSFRFFSVFYLWCLVILMRFKCMNFDEQIIKWRDFPFAPTTLMELDL